MMKNPWLNISWNDTIADVDKAYIAQHYGSVKAFEKKHESFGLDIQQCLPDPYSGNKDSKVYCLNMNPGEPDPCFYQQKEFGELTMKNLRHEVEDCFWSEGLKGLYGKQHAGIGWLNKKMAGLTEVLGRRPNVFFIEYFPYHSKKGFSFPKDLPSYEYSNELIREAIRQEKLIIIMRSKKQWIERLPELGRYPHIITLKSPAGGWLSPHNFVPSLTPKDIQKF